MRNLSLVVLAGATLLTACGDDSKPIAVRSETKVSESPAVSQDPATGSPLESNAKVPSIEEATNTDQSKAFADTIASALGQGYEVETSSQTGITGLSAIIADHRGNQLRATLVSLPPEYDLPLNPSGLRAEVKDAPAGLTAYNKSTGMSRQLIVGQESTNTMVQFMMSPSFDTPDGVLLDATVKALRLQANAG